MDTSPTHTAKLISLQRARELFDRHNLQQKRSCISTKIPIIPLLLKVNYMTNLTEQKSMLHLACIIRVMLSPRNRIRPAYVRVQ